MKTNILTLMVALLLLGGGFVACDDSDDPKSLPFTEYSLAEESHWVNLDYAEGESAILVINSDEELKNHIEGEYPSVDFSKKTLVLAYGCWSGGFKVEESIFRQVSELNYTLTLNGLTTALQAFIEWHSAIVVDKLPSGSKIELKTVIIN